MITGTTFEKHWCMHKQIMCRYANATGFCSMTACIMQWRGKKNEKTNSYRISN